MRGGGALGCRCDGHLHVQSVCPPEIQTYKIKWPGTRLRSGGIRGTTG